MERSRARLSLYLIPSVRQFRVGISPRAMIHRDNGVAAWKPTIGRNRGRGGRSRRVSRWAWLWRPGWGVSLPAREVRRVWRGKPPTERALAPAPPPAAVL